MTLDWSKKSYARSLDLPIDKVTAGGLLSQYPQIEWKRVMGMRDVLSHHYFDLDAEIVYTVCDTHIERLARTVQRILLDLEQG